MYMSLVVASPDRALALSELGVSRQTHTLPFWFSFPFYKTIFRAGLGLAGAMLLRARTWATSSNIVVRSISADRSFAESKQVRARQKEVENKRIGIQRLMAIDDPSPFGLQELGATRPTQSFTSSLLQSSFGLSSTVICRTSHGS